MNNYPKVLYRPGEKEKILLVNSEESEASAVENGWANHWNAEAEKRRGIKVAVPYGPGNDEFKEFPKMVYKSKKEFKIVKNAEDEKLAFNNGWKEHWGSEAADPKELEKNLTEEVEDNEEDQEEEAADLDPELKELGKRYTEETGGRPFRNGVKTSTFSEWLEGKGDK